MWSYREGMCFLWQCVQNSSCRQRMVYFSALTETWHFSFAALGRDVSFLQQLRRNCGNNQLDLATLPGGVFESLTSMTHL